MYLFRLRFVALCACLMALPAVAAAAGSEYRLGPGDLLDLQVLMAVATTQTNSPSPTVGGDSLVEYDLPVQSDGRVQLPTRPPRSVMAAGLTPEQFQRVAVEAFSHYLRYPRVIVTLKSARQQTVYLTGYFAKDGGYPLQGTVTALDAVALAGHAPDGDLSQVTLARGREVRTLDLEKAERQPSGPDNVVLREGDVLFVPEMRQHITVQGQVATPLNLPLKAQLGVREAIAQAGGPTIRADLSRVTVTHENGTITPLDLRSLWKSGGAEPLILVRGDVVTVPELLDHVDVLGEVHSPQAIPYKTTLTLDDALALCGGETSLADLNHVRVGRAGAVLDVDLAKARKDGTAGQFELQPGDSVTLYADQLFVLGAVAHPGPVAFHPSMTLVEALGSGGASPTDAATGASTTSIGAGGPTERANLYAAVLTHANGQSQPVDLFKLIKKGDATGNVMLQPGDTLYVPETAHVVYVYGSVVKSGAFYIQDEQKARVLDVLNMAGGPTSNARISDARLIRPTKDGQYSATVLRLDSLMRKGVGNNIELQPGDLLYVPDRGQSAASLSMLPALLLSLTHVL